jgi:hypothetical protein|mmetsp:Transcript_37969/g.60139  ORF Transcript_37969/g.60139 Transcript_37969/m.60139 type:complete len:373 (-) Transcript_37969:28-1146(-)
MAVLAFQASPVDDVKTCSKPDPIYLACFLVVVGATLAKMNSGIPTITLRLTTKQEESLEFWCQVLNAVTMVPVPLAILYAIWKDSGRWRPTHPTVLAGVVLVPASFASHIYVAFHGKYSDILGNLDEIGIAAGCPLVAWGLSRSHVLSSVLALMAVIFAAFVFFGPLPLRLCCTLRTGWIALMASMYASAMCWARRERDPNAINAPLVFAVGALLGMDSKHAAFGLLSHPLFHVGLWSWGYILGKSSVVFEKQMQQLDCEEVYVFTSDDKGYTSMRPLEEQETDATSTEPEPEGSCEAEFGENPQLLEHVHDIDGNLCRETQLARLRSSTSHKVFFQDERTPKVQSFLRYLMRSVIAICSLKLWQREGAYPS